MINQILIPPPIFIENSFILYITVITYKKVLMKTPSPPLKLLHHFYLNFISI